MNSLKLPDCCQTDRQEMLAKTMEVMLADNFKVGEVGDKI